MSADLQTSIKILKNLGYEITRPPFINIHKIISKLPISEKCKMNGLKIIPFLIRLSKEIPNSICNPTAGIKNSKLLNSVIFLDFRGSMRNKPIFLFPQNLRMKIDKCTQPLIIISVGLGRILKEQGHSNILIIDKNNKTIERFEPHGLLYLDDNNKTIDDLVSNLLEDLFPEYKYIKPLDYCPFMGPQSLIKDKLCKNINSEGLCVVFSILYAHLRIFNVTYSREEIIDKIIKTINSIDLHQYISYIDSIISDEELEEFIKNKSEYED